MILLRRSYFITNRFQRFQCLLDLITLVFSFWINSWYFYSFIIPESYWCSMLPEKNIIIYVLFKSIYGAVIGINTLHRRTKANCHKKFCVPTHTNFRVIICVKKWSINYNFIWEYWDGLNFDFISGTLKILAYDCIYSFILRPYQY